MVESFLTKNGCTAHASRYSRLDIRYDQELNNLLSSVGIW